MKALIEGGPGGHAADPTAPGSPTTLLSPQSFSRATNRHSSRPTTACLKSLREPCSTATTLRTVSGRSRPRPAVDVGEMGRLASDVHALNGRSADARPDTPHSNKTSCTRPEDADPSRLGHAQAEILGARGRVFEKPACRSGRDQAVRIVQAGPRQPDTREHPDRIEPQRLRHVRVAGKRAAASHADHEQAATGALGGRGDRILAIARTDR